MEEEEEMDKFFSYDPSTEKLNDPINERLRQLNQKILSLSRNMDTIVDLSKKKEISLRS